MTVNNIAAGIVLFNPDIYRLIKNITAILPQIKVLYIIDNNSDNILKVEKYLIREKNIILIKNPKNYGIAKALNQMCDLAISEGFEWIITLDQDTICPNDLIRKYLPYMSDHDNIIICPQFLIQEQKLKLIDPTKIPAESIELCITSASLTRLTTWKILDGFNEWLFIDGVDYDYCLRARRMGWKIIRVNDAIIDHRVGSPNNIYLPLGIVVKTYNHSSFRNYYIVRNNIYLLRLYWKELHGFYWLLKFVYFELIKLIFEKSRGKTLSSLLKGIQDGIIYKPDGKNKQC